MLYHKIVNNTFSYFRQYSSLSYFTVKETLKKKPVGDKILVQGWVRAVRKHKTTYFVDLDDGTCYDRLQIVIQSDTNKCPTYGSAVKIEGSLVKSSHLGQEIELIADNCTTLGVCLSDYPFENRVKYSLDYIRQFPHLRARTRRGSCINRIQSSAAIAVHKFFENEDYCLIHPPTITQNDCEGAGEVFSVKLDKACIPSEAVDASENESDSDELSETEIEILKNFYKSNINTEEYFGTPTFLTVSGQLHLEAMACAQTRVYSFEPVFRAEGSRTRQHASEFRMVEAEIAFVDNIEEIMKIAENCIKYIAKSILDKHIREIEFISENKTHQENYLNKIVSESFVIMSYKEAMEILEDEKQKLKVPVKWGDDFPNDHKNFLVKHCNNTPVFITMFPATLKPFYMKTDKDKKEAFCFDLFASFGGEICGGGLRENDEKILKSHPASQNLSWYLHQRKFGAVPHGGFGIGFERLLQNLLGISNIRDIIHFPRRKNDCKC